VCLDSHGDIYVYADISQAPGPVFNAEGATMDIQGLVRHQIHCLKRSCQTRQQQPADLQDPLDGSALPQAPAPASAALLFG
jgi:hypothetical protein